MKTQSFLRCCLLALWMSALAGCGGTVSDAVAPEGTVNPPAALSTALQGVYGATFDGKEFVSVITPELNWYALYFERLAHTNPDIFSGLLNPGINGLASITDLRAFQIAKSAVPLSGTASINAATLQNYSVNISGITSAQGNSLSFSATALSPTAYNLAKTALYADVQGVPAWQGNWYDGETSNTSLLQFAATGTASSVATLNYCDLSNLALTPMAGINMFKVSLNIPVKGSGGICLRTKDRLAGINFGGVAFIYKSPLPDKSWRLDLIAVDSTGSGISFRGER